MDSKPEQIQHVIHKEKYQKKYNKTIGHYDNLKKYTNDNEMSIAKTDNQPTPDKLIKREANYIKNIHIDDAYSKLLIAGLVNDKYKGFWCGAIHTLGVSFVMAQAELCLSKQDVRNPIGLFHFLINKQLNKQADPHMPRF